MATSKVEYLGSLRTKCTHLKSGTEIITDAPVDNHGKGEAFSPTDLVATAYVSCMLSIVGIYCNSHNIEYKYGVAEVTKIMGSNPRKIDRLEIVIDFSGNNWDESIHQRIINAAETCPVAKTIEKDVEVMFEYQF